MTATKLCTQDKHDTSQCQTADGRCVQRGILLLT